MELSKEENKYTETKNITLNWNMCWNWIFVKLLVVVVGLTSPKFGIKMKMLSVIWASAVQHEIINSFSIVCVSMQKMYFYLTYSFCWINNWNFHRWHIFNYKCETIEIESIDKMFEIQVMNSIIINA